MNREDERFAVDSQGVFVRKALFSLLAGFVITVLALYPTWALLEPLLILIFVLMSVLSIGYILFAIYGFCRSYWLVYKGALFQGVSDFYLLVMTVLSLYSCLRAIDPTNQVFGYTLLVAMLLVAVSALALYFFKKQRSALTFLRQKMSMIPASCLVVFVAVSRFLMLTSDAAAPCLLYCVASVVFITWLSLGHLSLREYSVKKWKQREDDAPSLS